MIDNQFESLNQVFKELKDFQLKTVEYAFDRLKENRRYLVADEVGLGKTKVAKGVIAKALLEHIEKKSEKTFRVFYICSNQALANQNLKDLNIFKDPKFIDTDLNRLIYLAKKTSETGSLMLSSLTPSTSFKITSGTGHQNERMLLYTVLAKLPYIESKLNLKGFKWLLIGGVTDWEQWKDRLYNYYETNSDKIVENIPNLFYEKLASNKIPLELKPCLEEINLINKNSDEIDAELNSVFDLIVVYSDHLKNRNINSIKGVNRHFKQRNKLVNFLRRTLIDISLENLDADLFVLDEFQRFKELVAIGTNKESEAAKLANKIFSIKDAKCLMLSATPFRMYTSSFDEIDNEDHYSELIDLLTFLNGNIPMQNFEVVRRDFFKALKKGEVNENTIATKKHLENLYKSVLCRTEKMIVSQNKNSIVRDKDKKRLDTSDVDLENFLQTDQLFEEIKRKFGKSLKFTIDYNLSVPYPLSFMDGNYKSKLEFTRFLTDNKDELKHILKKNKKAWLDFEQLQNYQLSDYPNAKFRQLVNETIEEGELWKLLWLPPSMPYYSGMGVYANKSNLSKTLIFSRWVMVPKMIAGLLSYEVERRTLGKSTNLKNLKPIYTPKKTSKGLPGKRKPAPILRLQLKKKKAESMRSFTLLYPSKTLSELDFFSVNKVNDYKQVRREKLAEISALLDRLKDYETHEIVDKDWYWVAPLLLDKVFHFKEYELWIKNLKFHSLTKRSTGETNRNKAVEIHLETLKQMFGATPGNCGLGKMPDNLAEIMMDMAFGSPANCVLRSLSKYFNWEDFSFNLLEQSLELGYDFMLFFDKPETISTILINESLKDKRIKDNRDKTDIHWNLVLRYCIDGNLLAVLQEYCHMLYSKNRSIENLSESLAKGLNIRTSIVKMEGLKNNNPESKNLRCHFAVNFGNQNLETDKGVSRAGDIIDNFNSPFRPFVLASTSLGQEGLDFHYYCRKIVHWNLPRNPVEFEQREGRINRFKGLVIRQNLSKKYRDKLSTKKEIWDELFEVAELEECKKLDKPEIIPYWFTDAEEELKIERIVPLLPMSKDVAIYKELISTLAIYRLTFGQPRQEELVNSIKSKLTDVQDLDSLYLNLLLQLCPFYFDES